MLLKNTFSPDYPSVLPCHPFILMKRAIQIKDSQLREISFLCRNKSGADNFYITKGIILMCASTARLQVGWLLEVTLG